MAFSGLYMATSCQKESGSGKLTGEVDFSITTGIPAGIKTYSPEDGAAFSHQGGANNVTPDAYDLRYKLEIYDGESLAYEDVKIVKSDFVNEDVTFNARLLAKEYKAVVWADFVAETAEGGQASDLYYNTDDLRNVSYAQTVYDTPDVLATDAADAYYTSFDLNLAQSGQSMTDVKLRRPFGKIRFIATDALSEGAVQTEVPASVVLDFSGSEIPSTFNALTGEASGSMEIGKLNFNAVKENALVNNEVKNNAYLLGNVYFFATNPMSAYSLDVTVNSDQSNQIGYRELSQIPVNVNKLTTVIGNFYTNEGSIEVIVDDIFSNGEEVIELPVNVSVSTLGEAESALEALASDPATGDKDIVITVPVTPASGDNSNLIEMPALSNNVTIILEGGISEQGLTIKDELASEAAGNDFTGKLVLKNNSSDTQSSLIINLPKGSCELDGGTYSSVEVTTADNTLVVGESSTIDALKVNKGNVKLYGVVKSLIKASGYSGTIFRCLSTQKSLENLLGDNISGYEKILVEVPADIDGGSERPVLSKPIDVYADAKIANVEVNFQGNGSSPVTVYDGASEVVLSNVKLSTSNDYSICKLAGTDLDFRAENCEFILTQGKSNQSGLNIQNGGTRNVISAELDGCYIGYYSYDSRVNKDMDSDYDYPEGFKWSSYSRGITTGYSSSKTYDGTATTNLTVRNSYIEGTYYCLNTLHNIKLNVDIDNSVFDGRAGFNIWTTSEQPSQFNVRNSKFIGRNNFSGPTESFGTIVINGQNTSDSAPFKWVRNINIVVENSDIVSFNDPQTETNRQYILDIRTTERCKVNFVNGSTLREIKNPRLNYLVSMNYWGSSDVTMDSSVILEGKEGVLLLPQEVWDGQRKTRPAETWSMNVDGASVKCFAVVEPSDLVWLAEQYNSGSEEVSGKGIILAKSFDLNWHEWTPIKSFSSYFIGNEFEIKNLKVTSKDLSDQAAGLIGVLNGGTVVDLTIDGAVIDHISASETGSTTNGSAVVAGTVYPKGTVSNVAVRNAKVSGNRYLGGIVGYLYGSIDGCSAESVELVATPDNLMGSYDNGDKVGGIVGFSASDNSGKITGNVVKNITITGYRDLGGVAGAANSASMESNSAENINITVDQLTNSYGEMDSNAGYVLGRNLGTEELDGSNTASGNNVVEKK